MLKAKGAEDFGIHAFLASNTCHQRLLPASWRASSLSLRCAWSARPVHMSPSSICPAASASPICRSSRPTTFRHRRGGAQGIRRDPGSGRHGRCGHLHRDGPLYARAVWLWSPRRSTRSIFTRTISVDACAVDLMRPAMYGAYHHITVMGQGERPQRPSRPQVRHDGRPVREQRQVRHRPHAAAHRHGRSAGDSRYRRAWPLHGL